MFGPSTKILIVDDFGTMRKILRNVLQQLGFKNIEEAENGAQALEKLRADRFDLLITDWNMPEMDGLELLKNIRADANLKGLPVMMVTAEAEKDKVIEAIKAGVNNYIVKPFTAETMKQKLDQIAERMKGG
ncbi:MAG: response regulator [Nitrospirae bacterium]|nr:MAG: response regulator [Nitrospirota bacterium]